MLDIQDYTEYINRKLETLTAIPLILFYINRITDRLMFKIKDEYKLILQTPEAMKVLGSTKKNNKQNKKWAKRSKS